MLPGTSDSLLHAVVKRFAGLPFERRSLIATQPVLAAVRLAECHLPS